MIAGFKLQGFSPDLKEWHYLTIISTFSTAQRYKRVDLMVEPMVTQQNDAKGHNFLSLSILLVFILQSCMSYRLTQKICALGISKDNQKHHNHY